MENSLDVLLLHHPTREVHRPILFPAMGLLSIADTLDRHSIRARVVHLGLQQLARPDLDPVDALLSRGARVIGISGHWYFQLPDSLELGRALKMKCPQLILVMGGFSASLFAEELMGSHPYVDVVVKGDGEIPFLEMCQRTLSGSRDWMTVPNLVYRDADRQLHVTPFTHTLSEQQLSACRFSNLKLLEDYERFLKLTCYPTKKFKHRFSMEQGGIFPLEVGRGCPHRCTFCGGNQEAQRRINNREAPIFRKADNVIESIREVLTYGCNTFYVCFDPYPNGPYYFDLFRKIRMERLDLRMIFGSWRLPSRDLVDEFCRTFSDGMFEISPETSSEALRNYNKGVLSYSNQELESCVRYISSKGLLTQLFFGYFLPGDTTETVIETSRYARLCESESCETFYLAFSTDPASLLQLHPDTYHVDLQVRSMQDYINALGRSRMSSNLLAHRPDGMNQKEAETLVLALNAAPMIKKVFFRSLAALELITEDERAVADAMERTCIFIASRGSTGQRQLGISSLADALKRLPRSELSHFPEDHLELMDDIIDYEAIPYLLLEQRQAGVSLHYSIFCNEMDLDEGALEKFIASGEASLTERTFRYDVKSTLREMDRSALLLASPRPTRIGVAVDHNGRVVTFDDRHLLERFFPGS